MFAPAATGSGASTFEIDRIGVEFTVTVTGAPAVGAVSFESIWKLLLLITVPFAGLGAAVFDSVRTGVEVTVVVAAGPTCGRVSLLSIVQPVSVITVPFDSGELTRTVSVTDPDEPAFTLPTFQVTTPPATDPD